METEKKPELLEIDLTQPKRGTIATAETIQGVCDIIRQRSGTHGDAHENLTDIARRWSLYLNGKQEKNDGYRNHVELNVADVAYMMVEMKLSRATYGDHAEVDHLMDIIGYAGIGASYLKKTAAKARKRKTKPEVLKEGIYHGVMKPKSKEPHFEGKPNTNMGESAD